MTLHLRECPAHEIKDPQAKELSNLFVELGLDSAFIATEEVYVDLSGTVIGDDWELVSLVAHDNHSDLYSVKKGHQIPFNFAAYIYRNSGYEGRVFTFDGIPTSVADSRRRNLKRFAKSIRVLCTQHQDGRTILIYEPKPKLPAPEHQADGRQLRSYREPGVECI